jgi:hypothetical protein
MPRGFFSPASATTDPSPSGDLVGGELPESATDLSLTEGKAGDGGSPESATDPSPARENEGGRLTETTRRSVEGVVIEKGFS